MRTIRKLLLKFEGIQIEMLIVIISGEWNRNRFSLPIFCMPGTFAFLWHITLLEMGNKNCNVKCISAEFINFPTQRAGLIMFQLNLAHTFISLANWLISTQEWSIHMAFTLPFCVYFIQSAFQPTIIAYFLCARYCANPRGSWGNKTATIHAQSPVGVAQVRNRQLQSLWWSS